MEKYLKNLTLLENQGLCNTSYLSLVDEKKYLIREFGNCSQDRKFEYKVQQKAYSVGIAAKPIKIDNKYLVSEYLNGIHKEILNKKDLRLLANTLKKLHKIKIPRSPYILKIKDKKAKHALQILKNMSKDYVLCHHDLNPKNIFFSDKIKLIDWEFAGVNDRYFDLASVCVEFKLNTNNKWYFLHQYSKKIDSKKLNLYMLIYKELWKEWFNNRQYHKLN
jgi:thiamine kinase-like enzyme